MEMLPFRKEGKTRQAARANTKTQMARCLGAARQMSEFFYIAVREDASLTVVSVSEAIGHHVDNLFGPYRTYQDAADAAVEAEWWVWGLTANK
jgi:hypothetical protein